MANEDKKIKGIRIKNPGNTFGDFIPIGSDLQHLKDGNNDGSVRTTGSTQQDNNYTLGVGAFSEGILTKAPSTGAHAQGYGTIASGIYSHAEGTGTHTFLTGSHAEGFNTQAKNIGSHAQGFNTQAKGVGSHAEGDNTIAAGDNSHVEGNYTIAVGIGSHAEGALSDSNYLNVFQTSISYLGPEQSFYLYRADQPLDNAIENGFVIVNSMEESWGVSKIIDISNDRLTFTVDMPRVGTDSVINVYIKNPVGGAIGEYSHAEGYNTTALDKCSHAEGYYTTASGLYSHAEGGETTATRDYSHAEGYYTTASGAYSHAEGYSTTASGNYSHSSGRYTIAKGETQTAIGRYNVIDNQNEYAFIIGNGTRDDLRSNAFEVDWNGNVNANNYLINGTNLLSYANIPIINATQVGFTNIWTGEINLPELQTGQQILFILGDTPDLLNNPEPINTNITLQLYLNSYIGQEQQSTGQIPVVYNNHILPSEKYASSSFPKASCLNLLFNGRRWVILSAPKRYFYFNKIITQNQDINTDSNSLYIDVPYIPNFKLYSQYGGDFLPQLHPYQVYLNGLLLNPNQYQYVIGSSTQFDTDLTIFFDTNRNINIGDQISIKVEM